MPPNLLLYIPTEPISMPAADDQPQPAAEAGLITPSLRRLLQVTTLLLILYFALLVLLDQWFLRIRPNARPLPDLYYAGHVAIALAVLVLIRWGRLQHRLGAAFLPLVIGSMSLAPIVLDWLVLPATSVGPLISQVGLISLRLAPAICLGLVLVAWYYRWWQVIGYVVVTSGLTILTNLHNPAVGTIMAAMVVQSITLLLFGYCISVLTARLNLQRNELMDANRRLQDFASTQERLAISRERNRVARELHDTLAHTLSGLTVQLETIKAYWAVDPATARKMLDTALLASRTGLDETRRALGALRVSPLDDLGLLLAMQTMVESAAAAANLRLQLELPEILPQLRPEIEHGLYRIAQEALANAVTHSQASSLTLRIEHEPALLTLVVADDGRGFDIRQDQQAGHYGIPGMRERAALLNGEFELVSAPGAGTRIVVRVPH